MTRQDAQRLLGLGEGPIQPEQARRAYVRRAQTAKLAVDPETFMDLRDAYELVSHGAGAPTADGALVADPAEPVPPPIEVPDPYEPYRRGRQGLALSDQRVIAREGLAALPDSAEARWTLLSFFPYAASPEVAAILCEGAARQPDEFTDELLFHFPAKVPLDVLERASGRAGWLRLLLMADVHAEQGRPVEALEVIRVALATAGGPSTFATLKLAARPVLSLHAHAQVDAASAALPLLKQWAGTRALDAQNLDAETAMIFSIIDELGRLDEAFPLEVRQVAARAAKRGDFQNAPYEARFAIGSLSARDIRKWRKRLQREAPTLAKVLGLDLSEEQLRPRGTPNLRIPAGWLSAIAACGLLLAWRIHRIEKEKRDFDQLFRSASKDFMRKSMGEIEKDIVRECADPTSEQCRRWRDWSVQSQDRDASVGEGGLLPDGGVGTTVDFDNITLDSLGAIGTQRPRTKPHRRNHNSR